MSKNTLRLRRFTLVQRLWHFILIIIFMLLSVTGLAWMYIETSWGHGLAELFGGISSALLVHRITGLVMLVVFACHIIWLIFQIGTQKRNIKDSLLGPASMVFLWRDLVGLFQHLGWVLGINKKPTFDRWSWWEKFDYWAVWWGFFIVGITGLMLYNPVLTSDFFPGWFLNIALWIHRLEALLAMGHIFTIHFTVEHFRPNTFPFNSAMFDGTVPLEEAESDHSAWVARLRQEGRLEAELVSQPPVWLRIIHFCFGYAMIILGVFLLIFALINVTALTLF
jgi:cytochrome b subunit of formate dehydrogenase